MHRRNVHVSSVGNPHDKDLYGTDPRAAHMHVQGAAPHLNPCVDAASWFEFSTFYHDNDVRPTCGTTSHIMQIAHRHSVVASILIAVLTGIYINIWECSSICIHMCSARNLYIHPFPGLIMEWNDVKNEVRTTCKQYGHYGNTICGPFFPVYIHAQRN